MYETIRARTSKKWWGGVERWVFPILGKRGKERGGLYGGGGGERRRGGGGESK